MLYHLPLRVSFALARETGLVGVELVLGPEALVRGPEYIRTLTQQYDMPVTSVHPPIVPYPGMGNTRWVLPRLVQFAERVDAPLVVLHTPKAVSEESSNWRGFVEAIEQFTGGAERSVRVSLENAGYYRPSDERYLLHDARRLRAFADRYDLCLTLDTAHAGTSNRSLLETYDIVSERVINIHVSDLVESTVIPRLQFLDTVFRHHQMPGRGHLALSQLVRQLRKRDYRGTCTLEMSPVAVKAWSLANVRQALGESISFIREAEALQVAN